MRRALGIVALAFCSLALAQAAWHTQSDPAGKYFVDLPAAPDHTPVAMKTSSGEAYEMHQYVCSVGADAFLAQFTTYPPGVDVSNPRSNLERAAGSMAKGLQGGEWQEISWTTHQGAPAVQALGVNRQGHGMRLVATLNGRDMVTLIYMGPPGSLRAPEVERFAASLRSSR